MRSVPASALSLGAPYTLWINSVFSRSYYLVKALLPSATHSVMDLSDDFRTFVSNGQRSTVADRISELASLSDKLIVVNQAVAESVAHPDKLVFQNGVEYETFQAVDPFYARPPFWPKPPGARYVGFIGGVSRTKTDLALLGDSVWRPFPGELLVRRLCRRAWSCRLAK